MTDIAPDASTIARVIDDIARENSSDPSTDDLTVSLAIELAETKAKLEAANDEITRLRQALDNIKSLRIEDGRTIASAIEIAEQAIHRVQS